MATLKLVGVSPALDGDYDLDVSTFTNRELHTIKTLSGVRAGELQAAMEAGDNDLIVAFAVILAQRAGKIVNPDAIWDADLGSLQVILDDVEAVELPLDSPSPSGNASNSDGNGEQPEPVASSGSASSDSGAEHPGVPRLTGLPGSETSPTSDPETLAS